MRLTAGLLAALGSRALAAPATEADEAFKQGRALLKAGKFAEASAQFERSEALDPQLGTTFNIAECDAHIGKLASALAAYREVVARDANTERRATADDRARQLEPRVPKLVVEIATPPAGLAITLDGRPIEVNHPIDLDFGDYALVVRATAIRSYARTIKMHDEGLTTTVNVPLVPDRPPAPVGVPEPMRISTPTLVAPAGSHRRRYAVVAAASGGAVVVAGLVVGVLARNQWSDAKAVCGGTVCATQDELDRATALGDRARSKAGLATGLAIGGGAIAVIGAILYATAPSEHAVSVTARVSGHGAGLAVLGRF